MIAGAEFSRIPFFDEYPRGVDDLFYGVHLFSTGCNVPGSALQDFAVLLTFSAG
jgi:hypothetical protein